MFGEESKLGLISLIGLIVVFCDHLFFEFGVF